MEQDLPGIVVDYLVQNVTGMRRRRDQSGVLSWSEDKCEKNGQKGKGHERDQNPFDGKKAGGILLGSIASNQKIVVS